MRKRYDWDDPRLTAYVLGELSERERAEVEAELAKNDVAREIVAQIRETADLLTSELQEEPSPALTPEQRAAILGWTGRVAPRRFNRFSLLVTSAAACLLVIAGVAYRTFVSHERSTDRRLAMITDKEEVAGRVVSPAEPSLKLARGTTVVDRLTPQAAPTDTARLNVRGEDLSRKLAESRTDVVEYDAQIDVAEERLAAREEIGAEVKRPTVASRPAAAEPIDSEKARETQQEGLELVDRSTATDVRSRRARMIAGVPVAPAPAEEAAEKRLELALSPTAKPEEFDMVGGQAITDAPPQRDVGYYLGRTVARHGGHAGDYVASGGAGQAPEELDMAWERQRGDVARADLDEERPEGRYFFEIQPEDERVHRGRPEPEGRETYEYILDNPFRRVADAPLSTFSIDVDTASYTNIRRFLNQGQLPPKPAVRIEEMINYFAYDYPQPKGNTPFSVNVEVAACPWNAEHKLARVGIKGKDIAMDDRPGANLVFLLDVSGSMKDQNKLPLLKRGMELLVKKLAKNDNVAIVTYRNDARCVLDSTPAAKRQTILKAIRGLGAGGSTNGAAGIEMAYDIAADNFVKDGINRVILATDGDFNVGVTERSELIDLIEERAKTGVFLTVLGFGTGNLKDANLEALADKGNGHYAYIDSFNEARKVLVEQVGGTFFTIAKDVKIQIEFNPGKVDAYRLIGYENRVLADRDFADDRKDAGEIGAGHTVTALYELVPRGKGGVLPGVDQLKYQQPPELPETVVKSDDLMNVRLRHKLPDEDASTMVEIPVTDTKAGIQQASGDFKFAAAVAGFGMLLRDSDYMGDTSFDLVLKLARASKGADEEGHRAEFINLVKTAQAVKGK